MIKRKDLSVLVIDDQSQVLEIYEEILCNLGYRVECASMPAEALSQVRDILFDVALIDVKISYKSAYLGGIILAEEIANILGPQAIIMISQFDVKEDVAYVNPEFAFLPKPKSGFDLFNWVQNKLARKIESLINRQYGFVAMPYGNSEYDDWYSHRINPWLKELGYNVRRMDEIVTTRFINEEIFNKIRQAHFILFFADEQNANAYMEAGFGLALNKFIIMISSEKCKLPFNIRSKQVIELNDEHQVTKKLIENTINNLKLK